MLFGNGHITVGIFPILNFSDKISIVAIFRWNSKPINLMDDIHLHLTTSVVVSVINTLPVYLVI